ncbi:hypothetical protein [Arthrobacter sp. TMS2-4]
MDIQAVKIADPEDASQGVLAIVILSSTEVPHMYWKKEAFLAPVRHGPHTQWMDERRLEEAFRERFEGRRRRQLHLSEFYEDTLAQGALGLKASLISVAIPVGRRGSHDHPIDAEGATNFFYSAARQTTEYIRSE